MDFMASSTARTGSTTATACATTNVDGDNDNYLHSNNNNNNNDNYNNNELNNRMKMYDDDNDDDDKEEQKNKTGEGKELNVIVLEKEDKTTVQNETKEEDDERRPSFTLLGLLSNHSSNNNSNHKKRDNNNNKFHNSFPNNSHNNQDKSTEQIHRRRSSAAQRRSSWFDVAIANGLLLGNKHQPTKSQKSSSIHDDGDNDDNDHEDHDDHEEYDTDDDADNNNYYDAEGNCYHSNKDRRRNRNQLQIAMREDKAVRRLKIIFLLLLAFVCAIVSFAVYNYTKMDEQDEFAVQFNYLAQQVINKLQVNAQTKMEAIHSFSLEIQAYAINTNSTWPNVTIPYYEEHVTALKSLTDAFGVLLFPIVSNANRLGYEQYTTQNNYWINASFDTQQILLHTDEDIRPKLDHYNKSTWFDLLWGPQYDNISRPDFDTAGGMSSQIFTTVHPANDSKKDPYIMPNITNRPYFPQWQAAPMSWYYQTTVNSDYGNFEDFENCTNISIATNTACLGIAWTDYNAPGRITTLLYPIFNQMLTSSVSTTMLTSTDQNGTQQQHEHNNKNVVAFLGVDIYWESYLKGILPRSKGNINNTIYVVVQSTCDQTFTFSMMGDTVSFVDDGDYHERKYNHMNKSTRFGELLYANQNDKMHDGTTHDDSDNETKNQYMGASLYDDFCQYDFHIYPSSALEDVYMTSKPKIYTVTVCCIFLFTIFVFVLYDFLVERRQKIVMRSALTSDSIVSSLFPGKVKDKLYNEELVKHELQQQHLKHKRKHSASSATGFTVPNRSGSIGHLPLLPTSPSTPTPLNNFINNNAIIDNNASSLCFDGTAVHGEDPINHPLQQLQTPTSSSIFTTALSSATLLLSPPPFNNNNNIDTKGVVDKTSNPAIADLYPDATVFFADIAGFTKWSSGRNPVDVFLLLETLYGKFDEIAFRRRVFKIETIGDCYVAVTGLPDPQPDHAVIMTRFANEMLQGLETELKTLAPVLGPESLELAMRVGMHSGSVIAGVLRGAKARFQLFGDTMNTAARMESNGERNRIHVSQATADLLIAAGKKHWVKPRKDMIEAKGKGKMQTYWVSLGRGKRRQSTGSADATTPSPPVEDLSAWATIRSSKLLAADNVQIDMPEESYCNTSEEKSPADEDEKVKESSTKEQRHAAGVECFPATEDDSDSLSPSADNDISQITV